MKTNSMQVIVGLLVLIFVTQLYVIFRAINPFNDLAVAKERGIVENAAKGAGANIGDFQYMAEIGTTKGFEDVEKLKKLSKYNEEVYSNAMKGDRAIAFADKMVLYRPSTGNIVYKGETPAQKQLKDQQQMITKVNDKVKAAGFITQESTEIPQIAPITNIDQVKNNPFYAGAANGDLILIYNTSGVVVLYSTQQDKPLNAAKTQLVPFNSGAAAPAAR